MIMTLVICVFSLFICSSYSIISSTLCGSEMSSNTQPNEETRAVIHKKNDLFAVIPVSARQFLISNTNSDILLVIIGFLPNFTVNHIIDVKYIHWEHIDGITGKYLIDRHYISFKSHIAQIRQRESFTTSMRQLLQFIQLRNIEYESTRQIANQFNEYLTEFGYKNQPYSFNVIYRNLFKLNQLRFIYLKEGQNSFFGSKNNSNSYCYSLAFNNNTFRW